MKRVTTLAQKAHERYESVYGSTGAKSCTRDPIEALDDSSNPRRTRGLLSGIYRTGVAHEAGRPWSKVWPGLTKQDRRPQEEAVSMKLESRSPKGPVGRVRYRLGYRNCQVIHVNPRSSALYKLDLRPRIGDTLYTPHTFDLKPYAEHRILVIQSPPSITSKQEVGLYPIQGAEPR